jgi:hypothetical protein
VEMGQKMPAPPRKVRAVSQKVIITM